MAEESGGSSTQTESPPELYANETNVTEKCNCASGGTVVTFQATDGHGVQTRCNFCGKILATEQGTPPLTEEAERILGQTLTNQLHFLPDTPERSLTNASTAEGAGYIARPQDTHSVVEHDHKTPIHGWYPIHLLFIFNVTF